MIMRLRQLYHFLSIWNFLVLLMSVISIILSSFRLNLIPFKLWACISFVRLWRILYFTYWSNSLFITCLQFFRIYWFNFNPCIFRPVIFWILPWLVKSVSIFSDHAIVSVVGDLWKQHLPLTIALWSFSSVIYNNIWVMCIRWII